MPGDEWSFTPDGIVVMELNNQPNINLQDGKILPDNSAGAAQFDKIFFDYTAAATNDPNKFTPGIIFAPSGKPVPVGSRYIKIGEGSYSGNTLVITNRDPKAYETIALEQFTGRITYGSQ